MKLAICIPWSSPFVWAAPVQGFLNLKIPFGVEVRWIMVNGWCSARRKTGCVEQAMGWGADYIFFVDADQVLEEDTLLKLWRHVEDGKHPIGAIQPSRGYFKGLVERPYQPVCWGIDGKPFTPKHLMPVIYGPLNCFIMAVNDFKDLARPWFSERFDPETMGRLSSLDQHFTKKLWDNKRPLWIDPEIKPKHMEGIALDWSFQDRFSPEDFNGK